MTTLYINDKEYTVPAGTSILEACRQHEQEVPYFCYHPELTVAANCRMCLVEVEGWPKPAASCCTPVGEGMKVRTQSEGLAKDRQMMMEYLLINHPLDCPVCDQGGACKLQDYALEYGAAKGRYNEQKRLPKDYDLGPFITTCMSRCIHCTRCVRFADEVAGTGDMGVLKRGDRMYIAGIVEDALDSELSGNLSDLCPVGALLDKPSHDVSRPWEVKRHKSTCVHCPHGCDISIETRNDEILRIRQWPHAPEPWICDRGRYVYDAFASPKRLHTPEVRQTDASLLEVSWDEAMNAASGHLAGKKIGILFSPAWSIEGLTAIRLFRDAAFPDAPIAYDLHRRDQRSFAFGEGFAMTTEQIEASDQVVILGSDLRQRLPLLMQRLRKRISSGNPVVRIGSMNYRTNAPMSQEAMIRPRDWAGVIARAMEQVISTGKTAAGMQKWIAAVEQRHESGKILADALLTKQCALIIGEEIRNHPDAAALIYGLDLLMRGCGHADAGNDGRNLIPGYINAQALHALFSDIRVSAGDLLQQASDGRLDALLVIGGDPKGDGLFPKQAKAVLENPEIPVVRVTAVRGDVSDHAQVLLPCSAYTEVEGSFINMEGRVRTAHAPLQSGGMERPLWKVMMRLLQELGISIPPVVNIQELRKQVANFLPEFAATISKLNENNKDDSYLMPTHRTPRSSCVPVHIIDDDTLDVVSRASMYKEGAWIRASKLLATAGAIHALNDVLVHPDTLQDLGLEAGDLQIVDACGHNEVYNVGLREDVARGVLFVARRGVAGALSSEQRLQLLAVTSTSEGVSA
ncbi:MAG: NADH-quinone oxidoreductase subunit NuoG [Mariprofundales bacterium]